MGGWRWIHVSRDPENLSQLWLGPFSETGQFWWFPGRESPQKFPWKDRVAGVRCAPASARGPLQPSRLGCGSHLHSPPAGPPRIASFKCRKLSSQVRAFDLPGVSLYWMVICPTHSIPIPIPPCPHPISPPWDCPFGTPQRKGTRGGEGGWGTNSSRVRPKESPFCNSRNPAQTCEDHGHVSKQPSSHDVFPSVGGDFHSCLPSERQKRREGESFPLAPAGS